MLQNLQNFANFKNLKFQLDILVDFEKCCKTRIFLQRSAPTQPKTSDILPKFCQKLATTLRDHAPTEPAEGSPPLASLNARRLPGALAGRPEPALRAVFSHVITCFLHAVWHVLHERKWGVQLYMQDPHNLANSNQKLVKRFPSFFLKILAKL